MNRQEWLEWLEARRSCIGASEVAAIVGIAPEGWGSPWSVWASKVGLTPLDDDPHDDDRYEFGHEMEAVLARMFTRRTGLYVHGEQTWSAHPEHSWARATVDGFVYDGDAAALDAGINDATPPLGGWEAKTDGKSWDWTDDGIPDHYQAQAQWSMFVTGLDRWWFAVEHHRFGGRRLGIYELERDEADISLLFARCEGFWHEHVLTGTPPPTDGTAATTRALGAAWLDPEREPAVDLDSMELLIGQWMATKNNVSILQRDEKRFANEISAALGDRTEGHINGRLVVSWRPQARRGIDIEMLRADHPDLCEKYETVSRHRVLRAHQVKR